MDPLARDPGSSLPSGMRIAIDASEICGEPTGVGRYLEHLLRHWARLEGEQRFWLLHSDPLPTWALEPRGFEDCPLPAGFLSRPTWSQQVTLPRRLRALAPDVLFAPAYTLPLAWRGPSVLTMHDISFEVHPEWFGRGHGARLRFLARHSLRRARRVLAVSRFTREEILAHYRLEAAKVEVVRHGLDESFLQRPRTPPDELRRRLRLETPFALMVGTLFERRYPDELLSAFERLAESGIALVIVGKDQRGAARSLPRELSARGLSERVHWLRYASEEDLLGLYACADQLIYLSAYEGFGYPPLEALACGLPPLLTRSSALAEIYADCAHFVEPRAEDIASGVLRLHRDQALRRRILEAGHSLLAELSMESCARATLRALCEVGQGG